MKKKCILLFGSFLLFSNVCIGYHEESIEEKQKMKDCARVSTLSYSNQKCHEDKKKYIYPIGKKDSIIGDYQISYEFLTNVNELIPSLHVIKLTGDTLYYAGIDILLCLKKCEKTFFFKRISKKDFIPFLEKKDIPRYSINNMFIEGVKNDSVYLSVNLCIPETDVCYDFIIEIGNDGRVNVKENHIESEMFE